MTAGERRSALVISLDFELLWGVADRYPVDGGTYRSNIEGVRAAVPAILELFEEHEIAATWATVGMLMARSRAEIAAYRPEVLPSYVDPTLSPYGLEVGADEAADPLHYGASLVELIRSTPRQRVGTHTFAHYYALAAGATRESFEADLAAARALAAARGIELTSIVFPRNQINPTYLASLPGRGITAYRGNPDHWLYRVEEDNRLRGRLQRAMRLADAYLPLSGRNVARWPETGNGSQPTEVRASRFLRPYMPALRALEPLRRRRIVGELEHAARTGFLYHLWWHPHNFGTHLEENLEMLRAILRCHRDCREKWGMRSLSMEEVVAEVAIGR